VLEQVIASGWASFAILAGSFGKHLFPLLPLRANRMEHRKPTNYTRAGQPSLPLRLGVSAVNAGC